MHLAQFCSGPTLLCHAQPGLLQLKHSYDQMQSKLSCTTFQQHIRVFNLMTPDVSLPTRNPLHSIPSLHHQSAMQSKLEHSNVNYNDVDIDYSAPESLADQPLNNGDKIQVPVIIKCSFQQNTIRLPPDIAFQVHLMSQMNDHRGNDLNMFNEIITCIKNMLSIMLLITPHLRFYHKNNLLSYSQSTIGWIFSDQYYVL
jgi:hypothetical protein